MHRVTGSLVPATPDWKRSRKTLWTPLRASQASGDCSEHVIDTRRTNIRELSGYTDSRPVADYREQRVGPPGLEPDHLFTEAHRNVHSPKHARMVLSHSGSSVRPGR